MAYPAKAPSKGLGKISIRYSVHLQPLNITCSSGSPNPGSLAISSHLNRVDLITISGRITSPQPQRMDTLLPTNTIPRKIYPSTIHTHRRWTHSRPPRGYTLQKCRSNQTYHSKTYGNTTLRKNSNFPTNHPSMETNYHIKHIIIILHSLRSQISISNSG